MDVFLGTPYQPPPPPFEMSRTFFCSAEVPEALFILQALRLSVVYKSINVHLGQGQDITKFVHYKVNRNAKNINTITKMLDFVYLV